MSCEYCEHCKRLQQMQQIADGGKLGSLSTNWTLPPTTVYDETDHQTQGSLKLSNPRHSSKPGIGRKSENKSLGGRTIK